MFGATDGTLSSFFWPRILYPWPIGSLTVHVHMQDHGMPDSVKVVFPYRLAPVPTGFCFVTLPPASNCAPASKQRILEFFILKTKYNHSFISTSAHLAVSYRKQMNFENSINFLNALDQYNASVGPPLEPRPVGSCWCQSLLASDTYCPSTPSFMHSQRKIFPFKAVGKG